VDGLYVSVKMKTDFVLIGCVFIMTHCGPKPFKELDLPNTIIGAEAIPFDSRASMREVMSSLDLRYGYKATIAHGYFKSEPDKEIDFVEVSIVYPAGEETYVCLMKAFALEDLPPDIISKQAHQIVSMTDDAVLFDLETVTVTADLPWRR
jgi:hypothetical protein